MVAGVAAAVGEGLGEGEGVGEGFDDFGSWSPVFSRCLTIVFISARGADFCSTFFGSNFSADLFSLFLFAADLSLLARATRESPDVLPDVFVEAAATNFSLLFRSVTLRGLVATCWRGCGFVFAVRVGGAEPAPLMLLKTTGLSVGDVFGSAR